MSFLQQGLVFLAATVISVPLFKRLGLGSVLGYLAAGVVIGPWGTRLISDVESVLHIAELGVVLLLFLIGLELRPSRLWQLRRTVFGLGTAQVVATGALLALVAMGLGLGWRPALIAGIGLSLSSTAFALQLLAEKNEVATDHGRTAFGILLFQDLAVIPVLALLPVLGDAGRQSSEPAWIATLEIVGVLVGVVVVGRSVIRPLFRVVAGTHSQELFTATALLIVLGTAAAVSKVGMSMALGAFLAGVLLADSEYRHELEADIEPFKGLLLGLFFIAVGMSVNLGLVTARPLVVIGLVVGFVALKALAIFVIGKFSLKQTEPALSLAVSISQGGEFAFVLFGLAVSFRVMDQATSELLVVVVSLSMATTPALYVLHERLVRPRFRRAARRDFDVAPEEDSPVIIGGFGRVGQVVGRILRAKRIPFTAMDASPEHIDFIKRFGNKVFYGDAARLDLLRAARADRAKVFVLAIDDVEASVRTAETVLQHFPHLTIVARARNRQHAYRLLNLGIRHVFRETFVDSLELTVDVLEALGYDLGDARTAAARFREHDEQLLMASFPYHKDEKKLVEMAAQARAELESLFEKDADERKPA
jgi:glutathione-regulated potassium-efflux system protein KefB